MTRPGSCSWSVAELGREPQQDCGFCGLSQDMLGKSGAGEESLPHRGVSVGLLSGHTAPHRVMSSCTQPWLQGLWQQRGKMFMQWGVPAA